MAIKPHGGILVNRLIKDEEKEEFISSLGPLPVKNVNQREVCDIEMIAVGAFSPLEGFMGRDDYESVLDFMRLQNGVVWPLPITLSATEEEIKEIGSSERILLKDERSNLLALLEVGEIFKVDKEVEAGKCLKTTSDEHPGVRYLKSIGDYYISGKVTLINRPRRPDFERYLLDPKETRFLFKRKGWKKIVAFQTRNPIHRAHEYLIKCALEIVDAVLIHPLVGETKSDDIPAHVRMKCYEVLLDNYFPKTRSTLSVFPAAMRYAGPREAILHAIARKNYGCTHFIVGRDHAGVGNFYGTYDAHYIFDEFERDEIDIEPLFFEHSFYCRKCGSMASIKTCPHPSEDHFFLSGTKVRKMLREGKLPPPEMTRPEVAEILVREYRGE